MLNLTPAHSLSLTLPPYPVVKEPQTTNLIYIHASVLCQGKEKVLTNPLKPPIFREVRPLL